MSEESEKVAGIEQLPIFPLPLVLMPFELLPLHIFESRYREMLEDVQSERNLFGVSLFEPSESFVEKPVVDSIGCVAEIRESHTLEDGRSNILTVGVIRYKITDYVDTDKPYILARVEFFEDQSEEAESIQDLADEVFELFRRVAEAAHKIRGQAGEFPQIEQAEPEQLSFLVGAAFNLENEVKYQMLQLTSTRKRLERMRQILMQAVDQVEETAKINKISRTNGHVKKNLDLDGI